MGRPIVTEPRKKSEVYCVYNVSKQAFVSLGVKVADTPWKRLRGLLGKVRLLPNEGMWVVPSRGVHTIGLLFSIDLIYLDQHMRVVNLVEDLGPFRFAPFSFQAESVLELPHRAVYESGTQLGDEMVVCTQEEMEAYLDKSQAEINDLPVKRAQAM
jgi:uncharacterized membrane protein (UPF0127 family)